MYLHVHLHSFKFETLYLNMEANNSMNSNKDHGKPPSLPNDSFSQSSSSLVNSKNIPREDALVSPRPSHHPLQFDTINRPRSAPQTKLIRKDIFEQRNELGPKYIIFMVNLVDYSVQ